jgi:hypothetical protein
MRVLLLLLLVSCSPLSWDLYKDAENHFSVRYAEGWEKQKNGSAVGFLSPKEGTGDLFRENVGVLIQDLTNGPISLNEYTELTKKQIISNA